MSEEILRKKTPVWLTATRSNELPDLTINALHHSELANGRAERWTPVGCSCLSSSPRGPIPGVATRHLPTKVTWWTGQRFSRFPRPCLPVIFTGNVHRAKQHKIRLSYTALWVGVLNDKALNWTADIHTEKHRGLQQKQTYPEIFQEIRRYHFACLSSALSCLSFFFKLRCPLNHVIHLPPLVLSLSEPFFLPPVWELHFPFSHFTCLLEARAVVLCWPLLKKDSAPSGGL